MKRLIVATAFVALTSAAFGQEVDMKDVAVGMLPTNPLLEIVWKNQFADLRHDKIRIGPNAGKPFATRAKTRNALIQDGDTTILVSILAGGSKYGGSLCDTTSNTVEEIEETIPMCPIEVAKIKDNKVVWSRTSADPDAAALNDSCFPLQDSSAKAVLSQDHKSLTLITIVQGKPLQSCLQKISLQ
ncbi:hypothetical protein [Methylovirgula sp. 4M-Z18]|uniref:hypothetical protein n=1 Tax=Methylovirgula sp. 4M-Z18 TaxID=2293567 RepID=UPI000E2F63E9|nr:hypothetical protein [Methylovirgula sp. 4M-Z18]RFB76665.1 hypothetical protein DYH55_19605 [Methylovirgula sp. 4M-Z18]